MVGQPAKQDQGRRCNEQRDSHDEARGHHVHLVYLLQVVQRPELPAVPDASLPDHHDAGDDNELDIRAEEGFLPGVLGHLPFGFELLEDRGLLQLQADVDRNSHQQERSQERDAPAPVVERVGADVRPRTDDHGHRHHDPKSRRGLQPAGVVAAAFVRHVLGDVGDGASIFATQAQALDHSQGEEQDRGRETDRLVAGDQPDHPRAQPHSGQGDEERVLAAHPVAQPSEEERPQRTDQESGGEQRNRAQQRRNRVGLVEKLDRQDRGQAPEDIEVIPLDDISHCRGDDHAPEVLRYCCHSSPLLFYVWLRRLGRLTVAIRDNRTAGSYPGKYPRLGLSAPCGAKLAALRHSAGASSLMRSTTSGLASVDTSPGSCLLEIAASTRRMILPERVFGMSGTMITCRGLAIAPIWETTDAEIFFAMSSEGLRPGFSATYRSGTLPLIWSATGTTAASTTSGTSSAADSISLVPSRCPATLMTSSMRPRMR